jgi:hypothetical protein
MRLNTSRIFAMSWRLMVVAAITIAVTVGLKPAAASAQPVEYVKVCSLYGPDFFYLPGTDICFDVATDQAIEATAGGAWNWRVPNNPRTWVPIPQVACPGGGLVKFGDITGASLTENAYSRYETTHYPLKLNPGQYIASVLYRGGFTGVTGTADNPGNFCMFYYYNDPTNGPNYTVLGCIDTAAQANVPATLEFSPDPPIPPIPPTASDKIYILGANGDYWNVASAADIQGMLSVWFCLQSAP